MQKKYKLAFFLLFIVSLLFSKKNQRDITFVANINKTLKNSTKLCITYLVDIAETKILENYESIVLKNIQGDVDPSDLKKVTDYVFSQGIDVFYYINVREDDNSSDINLKLYTAVGNIIYEKRLNFVDKDRSNDDKYISKKKIKEWLDIIYDSIEKVFTSKRRKYRRKTFFKKSIKYAHDFPFVNIAITALSSKIYFDERMIKKAQKIFSFFPVNIRLSFFPLKCFETGLFCKFNFDNMVFKYFDYDRNNYDYFDSNFIFYYGFFMGLSFFKKNVHYSIGLQAYNLFYELSEKPEWGKTNSINSFFIPQFALYQKLDFKLFKFIYFSIFFNFKTIPMFELKNNSFYSRPFWYDFFVVEISFAGLSIML